MRSPELPEYTEGEEIANAVTHAVGTGLSLAGLAALVSLAALRGGDPWRLASLSIYGTTLVLTHLASTLYHGFRDRRVKAFFRVVDHAAIYLLIAGTYTPFLVISLRGPWGWTLLGVVWAMAIAGVVFKSVFLGRLRKLSVVTYVVMGWLVVVASDQVLAHIPLGALALLLAGGVVYTLGIVFYAWKRVPFNHAIWHLMVLAGCMCHYFAIFLYLLPTR
ncbi:MAG: hemolysin III family protein [Candidatus Acetothermia bacterium]|jgi:hemolysin III|nr:hemolysin III family protein [Candidatus Acetothermia bacterium]